MDPVLHYTRNRTLGKVQVKTWNGQHYLVAPATLVVPGVLPGSNGPLLYPAEQLARTADAWNGMPLTLGHPTDNNGRPVSARSPQVLERVGVGAVYNVGFRKGRLRGEVWIAEEEARRKDARLLDALGRGTPVELSTGLFLQQQPGGGTFNGRSYQATAVDYRPDHLALLLGETGACSVADGCGVLVNEEKQTTNYEGDSSSSLPRMKKKKRKKKMAFSRKKAVPYITANCDCWKGQEKTLNAMTDDQLERLAKQVKKMSELVTANAELTLTANAAKEALDIGEEVTGNHLTIEIREKAKRRKAKKLAEAESESPPEEDDEEDEAPAKKKAKGKTEAKAEGKEEGKKEAKAATTNEKKAMTDQELLAALSPELRATINRSVQRDRAYKAGLVEKLTSWIDDDQQKEKLTTVYNGLDLDALEAMAQAQSNRPATLDPFSQEEPADQQPVYLGATGAPLSFASNRRHFSETDDLDMVPPTVNYSMDLPARNGSQRHSNNQDD